MKIQLNDIPEGFDLGKFNRLVASQIIAAFGVPARYLMTRDEIIVDFLSRRVTQWEGVCLLAICQEAAETSAENRVYYLELALNLMTRDYLLSDILRFDPVNEWHLLLLLRQV